MLSFVHNVAFCSLVPVQERPWTIQHFGANLAMPHDALTALSIIIPAMVNLQPCPLALQKFGTSSAMSFDI